MWSITDFLIISPTNRTNYSIYVKTLPITDRMVNVFVQVISYMEEFHNVNVHSLVLDLLTHNINPNTATYHHMAKKFDRYAWRFFNNVTLCEVQTILFFLNIVLYYSILFCILPHFSVSFHIFLHRQTFQVSERTRKGF